MKELVKPYAGTPRDIATSFLISHVTVYVMYWMGGGNFERNWWLGLTELTAWFLWGHLLTRTEVRERAALRRKLRELRKKEKHEQDTRVEYL